MTEVHDSLHTEQKGGQPQGLLKEDAAACVYKVPVSSSSILPSSQKHVGIKAWADMHN